jgi:Leucine-rich repeat (LRR) protein
MQITQNRSVFLQQDHHASAAPPMHRPLNSASPRDRPHRQDDPMTNRVHQPLVFSVDDRLAEEHLTRLDLASKNLRRIEPLPNGINFNSLNYDHNEISRLGNIDALPQLVQVRGLVEKSLSLICLFVSQLSVAHNRLVDIRLLYRLRSLQKLNLSYNVIDSIDCKAMQLDLFARNEWCSLFLFRSSSHVTTSGHVEYLEQ